MAAQQVITFRWWPSGNSATETGEIPEEHKTELEEAALRRIVEMRAETYICGELLCDIEVPVDHVDPVSYRGWWEFKEVDRP